MRRTYPGEYSTNAEEQDSKFTPPEEPDFIGGAPNYEKFEEMGWDAEQTLVWLNID